jgi:hypothetical protein
MHDSYLVCQLKKSLYGLTKDLSAWYVLGYEKGINIFLFPTVHDMILIDSSDS